MNTSTYSTEVQNEYSPWSHFRWPGKAYPPEWRGGEGRPISSSACVERDKCHLRGEG